jgi:ribonucleoside-diphosphate reductase beta chain
MILDPGYTLSLRPMKYPQFYEMYKDAIANTWTVEEVDFSEDITDLRERITPNERHMINLLVAFFATGDTIVANNLVINLYKNINSPEARMYLSRQLFEEAQHIDFYLKLLDTYIPNDKERAEAFSAVEKIPSIKAKAEFCYKWMDSEDFLMNLITFACAVEGLFFFAAFAYVYFLRSRGLCNGLASGTNWVFRDESAHMKFAFSVIDVIKKENPELFTVNLEFKVRCMLENAIGVEIQFAKDMLDEGIPGLTLADMQQYLRYVADQRLIQLGYKPYQVIKMPFDFMLLQDVQELTNFFERTVSSYAMGVTGEVRFDEEF